MTTSPASESRVDRTRVPDGTLWFYRGRVQDRLYDLIVQEFYRQEDAGEITKAALAQRLGRRPEQITRWLAAPSNLTLDTISDLLVGLRVPPVLTIEGLPFAPAVAQEPVDETQQVIDDIAAALAASQYLSTDTQLQLDRLAHKQPVRPEANESTLVGLLSGHTGRQAARQHQSAESELDAAA